MRLRAVTWLGGLMLLGGCATTPTSGAAMAGVALGPEQVYLVGPSAVVVALELGASGLERVAELRTPCAELLDVELHAEQLYVLCADGRVLHASVDAAAQRGAAAWHEQPLPELRGRPVSLQRSDHGLQRVELEPAPPREGITLDGPGPTDWLIDFDQPRGVDHWKRDSDWGPASSNASGDAFAFVVRVFHGFRLSLMSTAAGNASCALDEDSFLWPRDVAVDPTGRRFALLSDSALAIVELDPDGSVRATVTDATGGVTLRRWGRCHR